MGLINYDNYNCGREYTLAQSYMKRADRKIKSSTKIEECLHGISALVSIMATVICLGHIMLQLMVKNCL